MIGGYAQQSYGFNYYGTIGTNRDEFVIVRKMAKVDWLDRPPPISRNPLSVASSAGRCAALLSVAPKIEAAE